MTSAFISLLSQIEEPVVVLQSLTRQTYSIDGGVSIFFTCYTCKDGMEQQPHQWDLQ